MLRHFPHGRTARTRVAIVIALSASLVIAAFTVPSVASSSDPSVLNHHKSQLSHELVSTRSDLDETSHQLLTAQARLDSELSNLSAARATVAGLMGQVQQATARDARMQAAVDAARQRLAHAKSDLAQGGRTVERQRTALASYAVSSSQAQLSQLSTVSLIVNADSTRQAISQVQGDSSALAKQLTDLQRLQANQVLLTYTEQRVQDDTDQVAADRKAAAANLAAKQALETAAAAAQATVEDQVATLQATRDTLSAAKQAELVKIDKMKREQRQVEAALTKIAEQRAAQQRAAQQRAATRSTAAAAAAAAAAATTPMTTTTQPADGGYLSYPVHNTYVTSPYGMRMNPVMHVYELHDGTDFHAVCGTPVYAAAPGRVTQEYLSGAYGNRLFIDHGFVRGVSLATSYNHLTSYVARVGQQVARGQLVAYSGTTGWSTGCHLHFSVYVNGTSVNPMGWL